MRLQKAPAVLARLGKQLLPGAKQLPRLIVDPKLSRSYYPAEPRKSKPRILVDLLSWAFKHRDVNTYYYMYGFDRRHGVNMDDYVPLPTFRTLRDGKNRHPTAAPRYDYVCLLRDKFVFGQFVASLGFPTPKTLALCDRHTVRWLDQQRSMPLNTLFHNHERQFDAFCKPLSGSNGKGAFSLRLRDAKLLVNDQETTLAQLEDRLNGQYLLQERVQQHLTMSALHPQSLNTMRLVTFNNDGHVQLFSAALKMGTNGKNVDNGSVGGIVIGVDLVNGRLREEGLYRPGHGGTARQHPQTQVRFAGFEIPYFGNAVALVTKLHGYLYGIHSIGWDVAITHEGPVVIEGNDDWDGVLVMAVEKNFKQRFLSMYSATSTGPEGQAHGSEQRTANPPKADQSVGGSVGSDGAQDS